MPCSRPSALPWPHAIPASTLTDNGMVFTTRLSGGKGGRNGFENKLRRLGVIQQNSHPNRPTTCGKVERYQQTMQKWLAAQQAQPTHPRRTPGPPPTPVGEGRRAGAPVPRGPSEEAAARSPRNPSSHRRPRAYMSRTCWRSSVFEPARGRHGGPPARHRRHSADPRRVPIAPPSGFSRPGPELPIAAV